VCIFHGPFAELLERLNGCEDWRAIYGPPSKRLKDQELILRFLALFFSADEYSRPMNEFLNTFMGRNRYLKKIGSQAMTDAFMPTVAVINQALGRKALRPERALNAAVCDSIMVGLANRLKRGKLRKAGPFAAAYTSLLNDANYMSAVKTGTADEPNVDLRLAKATEAFAGLE